MLNAQPINQHLIDKLAPGEAGRRRVPGIMAYSIASALLSTFFGLYLSFHVDLPSGPSIVVVATGLFLLALLFSPAKGALWRRRDLRPSAGQASF